VDISNLGILRRNHRALRDNLFLSEPEVAVKELMAYKNAGGNTIVELSTVGMGRDVRKLRELSKETGVNIIASCGFYKEKFHPSFVKEMSERGIADLMIGEIITGINGSDIRAGVIGEIGTSKEISNQEIKVLRASAIAQIETGVPLSIHLDPWSRRGLEVLDILEAAGADLSRTVIGHVDAEVKLDYCLTLAKRGALIEFDNFGKEYSGDLTEMTFSRDIERVLCIKELIGQGFIEKLLISTDICLKTDTCCYGGWGYAHILKNMVPLMLKNDISKENLQVIMIENPRKLFDVA
jgi:phosphotriesterase-related protein